MTDTPTPTPGEGLTWLTPAKDLPLDTPGEAIVAVHDGRWGVALVATGEGCVVFNITATSDGTWVTTTPGRCHDGPRAGFLDYEDRVRRTFHFGPGPV